MDPSDTAAAPATPVEPAQPDNRQSPAPIPEPSTADLAKIISRSTPRSPKPATPAPRTAPAVAPAVDPELDPDFDGDESDQPGAAGQGEEPAAAGDQNQPENESPETPEDEAAQRANQLAAELDDEGKAARASFTPEQQRIFDREIIKKVRRHSELKNELTQRDQQIAALQQELTAAREAPPAPAQPTPDNPLADIGDEGKLDNRIAEARNLRRWLRNNPNGGTLGSGDSALEIPAERIGDMLADCEDIIDQHGPARREHLRRDRELMAEAVVDYPWLKNNTAAGTIAVERMLRQYGATRLRDIPGIRGSLADLFIGQVIRIQGKQKPANGAPATGRHAAPPKAPAVPPAGSNRPPRVSGPAVARTGALKTVAETGRDPGNAGLSALIGRR